jgi:hypothetical protein
VGPRAVLDAVVKRQIPSPLLRESNHRTPIVQSVAQRSTDLALTKVTSVDFINNKMYIQIESHWYDINVLNVHAPTEDKSDDTKNSFYEDLRGRNQKFPD